ncbi:MAG: AAA family ATPase, partial [Nitrospinae bacterium]|nr:AAA family ATPase [Nitrospinota bacterium]
AVEHLRALRAAQQYWQLAARYAQALQRPWLLLTCGLMGTGKSALAEALLKRIGAIREPPLLLSSDVTRKRLAGISPTARAAAAYGEGLYSPERADATYADLLQQAERLLAQGRSVLIDASFQRARDRLQAKEVAERAGAQFCVLECWCPEEEVRRRLDARVAQGGAVSDGRWELLAQQRQAFEPLFDLPPHQHLRVDTTQAPERMAEEVATKLALV